MTFAEFKIRYQELAAHEDACRISRDNSMKRNALGYRINGTESPESIQDLKDATSAVTNLLKSVRMDEFDRMWSGCGEDVTVEALNWFERLLSGLDK